MDCIECKTANPDDNRFCGKCGAELGRTLEETVRKKGFRDRQATEMEITEAVVERLMKWSKWLGAIAAVVLGLFAVMLGWSYHDVRTAVNAGKSEIETSVKDGKAEIEGVRQNVSGLRDQVNQLQSDINSYQLVNRHIEEIQKKLTAVQDQVIDLGKHKLKASSLELTGPGPGNFFFGETGCPFLPTKGVTFCALQGSPPVFSQVTPTSGPRPVASLSPVGFQDTSTAAKPACSAANRGTFYVEKGAGNVPDKPFLCARKSDNTYGWIQLSTAP